MLLLLPLVRGAIAAFASAACAVSLRAQDVFAAEPFWVADVPTNERPKLPSQPTPHYPPELGDAGGYGYGLINRPVTAKGTVHAPLLHVTHGSIRRDLFPLVQRVELKPLKVAGKVVHARAVQAVIFNPKRAPADGPDAAPRLLAVTWVQAPMTAGATTVWMRLSLDAEGKVTDAEPTREVKPEVLAAIREALPGWRFAPARKAGSPVSGRATIPVLVLRSGAGAAIAGGKEDPADHEYVPPKLVKSVPPQYPVAMRRYGINGEVLLALTVSAEGKVTSAHVRESDNPAFDEPAVKAVLQWTFEPARRKGEKVEATLRLPVVFRVSINGNEGSPAYQIRSRDPSKLPEELRYDTPPSIKAVQLPVYPYALRRDGVRGEVRAVAVINERGQVAEVKVLESPRPEFGQSLMAALEGFRFSPALRSGKPVATLLNFEQQYDERDLPDEAGATLLGWERKSPERIVSLTHLDRPPQAISQRPPLFPLSVPPDVTSGAAVVECLIDRDGRVRLPRVDSATHEAFGYAAVQAAQAWWYEPPLVKGKPVVARVKIPFNFTASGARK